MVKKKKMEDLTKKKYFTTFDLVKASWFPIKSASTITALCNNGIIKGVNISSNPKLNRYRISKEEVIKYLVNLEN